MATEQKPAEKDADSLHAAQEKIAELEAELAAQKTALGPISGTVTINHKGEVVTD